MIRVGKLTGEVKDDIYVEVIDEQGVHRWAKISSPFGVVGIPDADWLKENGNAFSAVFTDYNDNPSTLLLIGLIPITTKKSLTYKGNLHILSERFSMRFDDKEKKLSVVSKDSSATLITEGFKEVLLESEKVSVGKNAIKHAVYFEVLEAFLNELISTVSAAKAVDPSSGFLPLDPTTLSSLANLQSKIKDMKSSSVKLK